MNNQRPLIDRLFPTNCSSKKSKKVRQHNLIFKKKINMLLIMNKHSQTLGHNENPIKVYYDVLFGDGLGLGLDRNDFKRF